MKNNQEPEKYKSKYFLDNAGIQLNPGDTYDTGSNGYLRMNIALPRVQLKEALNRMREAIEMV